MSKKSLEAELDNLQKNHEFKFKNVDTDAMAEQIHKRKNKGYQAKYIERNLESIKDKCRN